MVLVLALLEGTALFTAVCGVVLFWTPPLLSTWGGGMTILGQALALCGCCIIAFYYNDLYDLRLVSHFSEFASRLLQAFGLAFILLAFVYALVPGIRLAHASFAFSLLIVLGLLLPLRAISYAIMRSRNFGERVLVLGTGPLAVKVIREIEARPHCGYVVVGAVDETTPNGNFPFAIPVRRPAEDLDQAIRDLRPHRIVVALPERRGRLPVRQLLDARFSGIPVEDGAEMYERLTGKLVIESLTPSYLIFSKDFKKARLELALSRALSLALAPVMLVVLAPLLAAIALAVKLESRGPVFFCQQRVGMRGRPFTLIKFRTMRLGSAASEWVGDNEARITEVGRFLRRFRLDELPQFLNILHGDMNLIGPRPHPVSNFQLFVERIPYYGLRATVRPGVTGWAQVRYGYANNLEEETEKMRYDLYYIKHLSLWLDLKILFDTVKIALLGRGSTGSPFGRPSAVEPALDQGAVSPLEGIAAK